MEKYNPAKIPRFARNDCRLYRLPLNDNLVFISRHIEFAILASGVLSGAI